MKTALNYRYTAKIVLETETPMALSSGEKGLTIDKLVYKDKNGLPSIPGTSIAGVMRHLLINDTAVNLFGQGGEQGQSSRLIVTSAQMIGKEGEAIECNEAPDMTDNFYSMFRHLPVRQHVKMNNSGVACAQGKFDEEILYKGVRFVFEIELKGDRDDCDNWKMILSIFNNDTFRLGGGTRKGFGGVKAISIIEKIYDLSQVEDRKAYILKSSSFSGFQGIEKSFEISPTDGKMRHYQLLIEPEDFFLFSSGFGSEDADITPVKEKIIEWDNNGIPHFTDEQILIPASSIKGAIAHRTAYHFNKIKGITAELLDSSDLELVKKKMAESGYIEKNTDNSLLTKANLKIIATELNPAIRDIFGFSNEEENLIKIIGADGGNHQRGKIIMSDIYKKQTHNEKLFNHVKIDRFTGGAIDGALFSETVTARNLSDDVDDNYRLDILLDNKCSNDHVEAFEKALNDICTGMLPLGGGTMRGHGCFKGSLQIN